MRCDRCARRAGYRFVPVQGDQALRCTRHAISNRPVARRALRVALVVGTVLFAINQLDVVLRGDVTALVGAKVVLTSFVPYGVSTYSALRINAIG